MEETFGRLKESKSINGKELLEKVNLLRTVNISRAEMANFLSNSIGRTVSNQQAPNFLASRYGGPCVEHRVELLVECLLLEDADGVLCGIVMINAAQKELYKWWGETLPLNWTHHSNNLGFHLGELMITAGNGLGISVCDMLVADQR
ncbi:hypothetical protein F443_03832 [Phytophthora nicotianae P1569]|uniref:ZSWIM1/3 RNaseH-like domain-containing protein n=1 Tax=Phytophthora nicotianae P1569 TaxID=1317065 RepID=V9FNZ8_PHYNI|nr:hypothetical protein F443_03832 [Phytophthora nicotianae P1569]